MLVGFSLFFLFVCLFVFTEKEAAQAKEKKNVESLSRTRDDHQLQVTLQRILRKKLQQDRHWYSGLAWRYCKQTGTEADGCMSGGARWWVTGKAASSYVFRGGGREKQRVPRRCSWRQGLMHVSSLWRQGWRGNCPPEDIAHSEEIQTFNHRAGLDHCYVGPPAHRRVSPQVLRFSFVLSCIIYMAVWELLGMWNCPMRASPIRVRDGDRRD